MEIKKVLQSEKANAMSLTWDVFLEFEAYDYVRESINYSMLRKEFLYKNEIKLSQD